MSKYIAISLTFMSTCLLATPSATGNSAGSGSSADAMAAGNFVNAMNVLGDAGVDTSDMSSGGSLAATGDAQPAAAPPQL